MRPKYSSPGADALNCSHLRCAHLLLVASHGSLLFGDAFGFALDLAAGETEALGFALDVAVAAGVAADAEGAGVASNKPRLANANASDNVDGVSLTVG